MHHLESILAPRSRNRQGQKALRTWDPSPRATFGATGRAEVEMKEITCMCGWKTRGTQDEVIDAIQAHAWSDHGVRPTREELIARTIDVD